jgi:hypothetical protein
MPDLTYYLVYRDESRVETRGIFVMDAATGSAILWNHRLGEWTYDPDLVVRFLDDYRNGDRYENVDRAAAEGAAGPITGGSVLPEEATIVSILDEGLRRADESG